MTGDGDGKVVIPLASEGVSITKREVVTGRSQIRLVPDAVEEQLQTTLNAENVEIRRIPVNRHIEPGSRPPEMRTEDGIVIIPVIEEVAVIEKRLVLKEELHIHRHKAATPAEIPVTLRKQRAVVENLKADGTSTSTAEEN